MLKLRQFEFFLILTTLLLLVFTIGVTKAGTAVLVNNGYQNVTVAISDRISKTDEDAIVNGIYSLFESATSVLFTATGNRGYFYSIGIVYPPFWSEDNELEEQLSSSSTELPLYYSADIRIAPENKAYGNLPYTQQSRGCGEPGDFIHLTPDFVVDPSSYGPAEKLLVTEWIKYRYGVFDENGYAFDYTYPQMYFGINGIAEYNMCNDTVVAWDTRKCNYNGDVEGLPSDCDLEVSTDSDNVTSSMLSMITLPVAPEMCHNKSDHNAEAPNKQNTLCRGQSAMEIILQHEDFQDGKNTPVDTFLPVPEYYQEYDSANATLVFFLIWDPMTMDQTYYTAGPAILKFVYLDFPTGSYFGAIDTLTADTPVISVTQVTATNRYALWTKLLNGLRSSETPVGNIYSAINAAVQDLETLGRSEFISYGFVVMSNTEDKTQWSSVCAYATNENVQLHLITYSQNVANEFDTYCQGQSIVITSDTLPNTTFDETADGEEDVIDFDSSMSDDIETCLANLIQRAQLDVALMSFPGIINSAFTFPTVHYLETFLHSKTDSFVVNTTNLETTYFYVDTCRNIEEHPPASLITVWLGNPENIYRYDDTIQAFFNEAPLSTGGSLEYHVEQSDVRNISAPFTVYTVSDAVPRILLINGTTIELQAWVVTDNLSSGWTTVRIYASLTVNGTTPVYEAKVVATVTKSHTTNATQIVLLDNGSGNPDITANDGVYSSYFTQIEAADGGSSVAYTVLLTASDNGGVAKYPTVEYPWITGVKNQDVEYTQPFNEQKLFTFSAHKSKEIDDIPPGGIYDFRVLSLQGTTMVLEWTAPGDDFDYGTASSYVFKCSTNRQELIDNFDSLPDSEIPDVLPGIPGYTQTVTLQGISDKETHYCAMKTYDDGIAEANVLSNIISYYIESR